LLAMVTPLYLQVNLELLREREYLSTLWMAKN